MQLVVPIAVKNAVSAATITFTASSITLCFFISEFSAQRFARAREIDIFSFVQKMIGAGGL